MGNNICSCDEKSSEATVAPLTVGKAKNMTPQMEREDSRAKLMVPTPVSMPIKKEKSTEEKTR